MSWADSLLPPENTTPWEYAVEGVSASRYPWGWAPVRYLQSPQKIRADLLPLLAWARSVDIWHARWGIEKQREVTASANEDHRLVGTIAGIRRYLAIEGDALVQFVAPPQRVFAGPILSKAEQDAWLDALPQLRIYFESRPGVADAALFADDGFADAAPVEFDDAAAHYGRFPVLYRNGVETPLITSQVITTTTTESSVQVERVSVPGVGADTFGDNGFADSMFVDAEVTTPLLYTLALDLSYDHRTSELALTQATPGLTPVSVNFEQESEVGDASLILFADDGVAGDRFAAPDLGPYMVYQMVRLNDPAVIAPIVAAVSFCDDARLGMPSFTLELLVDASDTAPLGFGFEGGFADDLFAAAEDQTKADDALDAIVISKGLENRALVSFEVVRQRTWGDGLPLDGSTALVSMVPNSL